MESIRKREILGKWSSFFWLVGSVTLVFTFTDIDKYLSGEYKMMFTSWSFIFLFVPLSVFGYYLSTHSKSLINPGVFITICSILFYMSWGSNHVVVLIISIVINYSLRWAIIITKKNLKKNILYFTISINLLSLFAFKYFGFFDSILLDAIGISFGTEVFFLPLAISFFTFQEIMLALDAYYGIFNRNFFRYALFVTFFPHLVAGPLVHHREMMPQFQKWNFRGQQLFEGLALISIGFVKKVLIADQLAPHIGYVFDTVEPQGLSMLLA